eukprot:TRINITY_DN29036_c0_g1_i2.p1 TRINITY_DN29036_c0_g1~~TRINITY_DN29036_c0_g1_i2.p1  ORF type:complete len:107 (+),score=5.56 TRINITY_DN29036_c0_g1_i2:302-622(+)
MAMMFTDYSDCIWVHPQAHLLEVELAFIFLFAVMSPVLGPSYSTGSGHDEPVETISCYWPRRQQRSSPVSLAFCGLDEPLVWPSMREKQSTTFWGYLTPMQLVLMT